MTVPKSGYRPRNAQGHLRVPSVQPLLALYVMLAPFFLVLGPIVVGKVIPGGPALSFTGNVLSGLLALGIGVPLMRTWAGRSTVGRTALLLATLVYITMWTLAWCGTWSYLLDPSHRGAWWGP